MALSGDANSTAQQDAVRRLGIGDIVTLRSCRAFKEISNGVPVMLINEPRPSVMVAHQDYLQYPEGMLTDLSKEQRWT